MTAPAGAVERCPKKNCHHGALLCRGCGGAGCYHCGQDGREGPCDCVDGWVTLDTYTTEVFTASDGMKAIRLKDPAPWAAVVCPGDTVLTDYGVGVVVSIDVDATLTVRFGSRKFHHYPESDLKLVFPDCDTNPYRQAAGLTR